MRSKWGGQDRFQNGTGVFAAMAMSFMVMVNVYAAVRAARGANKISERESQQPGEREGVQSDTILRTSYYRLRRAEVDADGAAVEDGGFAGGVAEGLLGARVQCPYIDDGPNLSNIDTERQRCPLQIGVKKSIDVRPEPCRMNSVALLQSVTWYPTSVAKSGQGWGRGKYVAECEPLPSIPLAMRAAPLGKILLLTHASSQAFQTFHVIDTGNRNALSSCDRGMVGSTDGCCT